MRSQKKSKIVRCGFSLVEILVSITIILVLTGITFSAFRQSVHGARRSVCMSNVRQIVAAMSLYQADHGSYPIANDRHPALLNYIKAELKCPIVDAANADKPERMRVNYHLRAFFDHAHKSSAEQAADRECMASRGGSFPIVFDHNHSKPIIAASVGKSFLIIGRVDGSVNVEDYKVVDRVGRFGSDPCPSASIWSNL